MERNRKWNDDRPQPHSFSRCSISQQLVVESRGGNTGTGPERSRALTFAPSDCTSNLFGSEVNTNGLGWSTLSPVHLLGPVSAVTWCGLIPALTPFAVGVQLTRSRPIFAGFSHARPIALLMGVEKSQHPLAEASRHWKSCPVFWLRGCIPRA